MIKLDNILKKAGNFAKKNYQKALKYVIAPVVIGTALVLGGCSDPMSPEVPDDTTTNSAIELSLKKIDNNYLGDIINLDYNTSDQENDDESGNIDWKIIETGGTMGTINGKVSDGVTTDKGYTVRIRGPPSYPGQVITNEDLSETGPFTIKIGAYDSVNDNTGTMTIDGLVEGYETRIQVYDGNTNPKIRISNEDYNQLLAGFTELYNGGSPENWQKSTVSDTEMAAIRQNYINDSDKAVSRTYNNPDDFDEFDEVIRSDTAAQQIVLDRYKH